MAPEPEANGGGVPDGTDSWGVGGVVGDGRYRMTHRLGRGGMAEVYAAEDVRLGRTVAVKLLRSDLAEDPVSKARFTREAQSVAGLNHHAIVAVYDSGEDVVGGATVPYIVMELVEGRTIRDLLISAEAPPPEQALIIVSGVLEALAYSHQHGIVHRDIKPANVIITNSGAVKVMDFGIARALHGAQSTMTQTGMVMGTPQYLSPEQALGKAVDHRSDLYATGCLLYELLAMRPPFTGETPLSVVYQHVQDTPVPPSHVYEPVPPELDGLVMRSLAKEPDDRFQSAEEMRGLVQYALQMLQVQGGHTGAWNTGPVMANDGGHTTAMPLGGATTAMAHPMHGDTSQGPILPPMNPEDGAYAGGHHNGGGRGKMWLFVLLALIAIGAGVAFAVKATNDEDPGKKTPPSPTTSVSPSPEKSSKEPSDEPTDEESEAPENSTGDQNWQPSQPSWTPSDTPTWPTQDPSVTPSSPAPGTSEGNGTATEGGTGDDGGSDTEGGGDDDGDDTGATTEGSADVGGGDSSGTAAGAAAGAAAGTTTTGSTTP
ncbi:serine/threonine protein kinase [Streptomyces nitrosporeus]|uniref:non-specific serine/threonine protein kinase n=1 Tax=Streptomyces nitrosporeus TaxID=28894 RepID=A0A5J6FBL2_9ACTN|nr:protein kinase [Streptomyces nitrosporeus]QEU73531.1 serine/threonine protein kinase [Streptomyces nitrosporeus]GGZ03862.1 serine/threonine protein kinase [Streptomyces nitrosporeus]